MKLEAELRRLVRRIDRLASSCTTVGGWCLEDVDGELWAVDRRTGRRRCLTDPERAPVTDENDRKGG